MKRHGIGPMLLAAVVIVLAAAPCLAEAKDDLSFTSELTAGAFGDKNDRLYYVTNGDETQPIEFQIRIKTKQKTHEKTMEVKPATKALVVRTKGPVEGEVSIVYAKYVGP